jgi:hypothetical protein
VNACTIDILAALNPESTIPRTTLAMMEKDRRWSPLHDAARDRFLSTYVRTNFGYYIASQFANRRLPFPITLMGRDQWVFKAYMMKLNPWANFDRHIAEAYHLVHYVKNATNLGQHLKAMMLSFKDHHTAEEHLMAVHKMTGVPLATLDAFEILFFNVIDRRADALYLASEVYPDTRIVEFDENYMRNSTHADLIKRVAYNHRDMSLTAYLAGIGDHSFLKKLAASEDREADLTRYLMGNGLILAHTSLLNQRSIGISRVSTLLAASRQGGADQEEPTTSGIVPMYTQAFKQAISVNSSVVLQQMRVDAGMVEV